MELSPEDALRLNVLLANEPLAIRINESAMTVSGLMTDGESTLQLNPTGREDQYVRSVKELLSGQVLGSPGGYPVYLQRWTRMGQMRDQSLEELLKLGEPEAVVAAVCAPGLSNELARRAWWAMEDAENARQMLRRESVVTGNMGPVLAAYLAEHLPFEIEPEKMIETVRLILQPGLIGLQGREELWKKAQRKNAYYVGFLSACPRDLPVSADPHPLLESRGEPLRELAQTGNPLAGLLLETLDEQGQAFLETVVSVLKKPANQDVVIATLESLAANYHWCRASSEVVDMTLPDLIADAEAWLGSAEPSVRQITAIDDSLAPLLIATRVLSGMSYGVVRPVLTGTDAMGSLMRRKLEPVMQPLMAQINALRPLSGK